MACVDTVWVSGGDEGGDTHSWAVVTSCRISCMETHTVWNIVSASVSGKDFHAVQDARILREQEADITHHC